MRIVKLALRDFRAFPGDFELPLKGGCNLLLHGENGSGKSSLAAALREFLSLERPFPRLIEPFVHVFAPRPDPVSGVVAPRSARVELHFDTAAPAEVIVWSTGHLHPLELDDGRTPASTTNSQREMLVGASRQSGFFDYRTLLRSSLLQGSADLGTQLFTLFVETLLAGFQPDGGAKTLAELWERVRQAKPRFRYQRNLRQAKVATDAFNAALAPFLDKVKEEANRLLDYFPGHRMKIAQLSHPGCQYWSETKELLGDRLTLEIQYAERVVPKHEEFLNEARLTALGLALFLAAVRLADSNPADPAPLRVLLLDDVLIGLDLSNRLPLLDLLHREFPNHQIFLLTHDIVWFDIAKAHTEHWGTWKAFSLHAEPAAESEPDTPRLKGDMDDLKVAERHLDRDKDLRAAAVYVRAALEASLRKVCKDHGVMIRYTPNPLDMKADTLWTALLRRHVERKRTENKRLLDEALIIRISAIRSAVLNRLSHTGPPALTEADVRAAITTVRAFRTTTIPYDP